MNILYLSPYPIVPSDGGVERVTDVLAKEFLSRGHQVVFMCYKKRDRLDYGEFAAPQYYIEFDANTKITINNIITTHAIEFVINQCISVESASILKFLPNDIKVISVCHTKPYNFDENNRRRVWVTPAVGVRKKIQKLFKLIYPHLGAINNNRIETLGFKECIPLSQKVCFISDKFYSRVLKHIPNAPMEKFTAINNPNTIEPSGNFSDRKNVLLFVGRISNIQKNVPDFIRIWDILYRNNPAWEAKIVGAGEDLEWNIRLANKLGVKRLSFEGYRQDIQKYYRTSRIVLVTSFGESWCLVLTEAMANGCIPAAFMTYESLTDIIDDGVNGIVTKPDVKEMALRIQAFINDPSRQAVMEQAARSKSKQFSVSRIANQWEDMLRSL